MSNPKTTIAGYLVLAASLLTVMAKFLSGAMGPEDWNLVVSALAGVGLIAARDGSH